jgi:hypothetical protein
VYTDRIRIKKQEIRSTLTRKNLENHALISPKIHYYFISDFVSANEGLT